MTRSEIVEHIDKRFVAKKQFDRRDFVNEFVRFCAEKSVSLDKVMYLGNDLNDIDAMKCVGIKGAPKNAEPEILEIADWISGKNGGYGGVRELARILTNERCN